MLAIIAPQTPTRFAQGLCLAEIRIANADQFDPDGQRIVEERQIQVIVGVGVPHEPRADDADSDGLFFHETLLVKDTDPPIVLIVILLVIVIHAAIDQDHDYDYD